MPLDIKGQLTDSKQIRAGFIGCGSHSFRNIFPTFQFAPVNLVATCDLSIERAEAYAAQFGAPSAYSDYHAMLASEHLDAVFIVTNYDDEGRPRYPQIAIDCLEAGCHVWIEKPPAASCNDIERMQGASEKAGRNVVVGFKKMFMPANRKAKSIIDSDGFGSVQLVNIQYPQLIPTVAEFDQYLNDRRSVGSVIGFLDHIAHPASLMISLLGMPETLFYQRAGNGAGIAMFQYASGTVVSLSLTQGSSNDGGMERTLIVSDSGQHIVVENNIRVTWHRPHHASYGASPDYFAAESSPGSLSWQPEFSLGQLYNKGLFLMGYYDEVNEFAQSILESRPPRKGTLAQARHVTRIFEAFGEGPGRVIGLG